MNSKAYTGFTLAGVDAAFRFYGEPDADSQPTIRVPKVRTSLKPRSPAKGVRSNGVRILRLGGERWLRREQQ